MGRKVKPKGTCVIHLDIKDENKICVTCGEDPTCETLYTSKDRKKRKGVPGKCQLALALPIEGLSAQTFFCLCVFEPPGHKCTYDEQSRQCVGDCGSLWDEEGNEVPLECRPVQVVDPPPPEHLRDPHFKVVCVCTRKTG